MSPSVMRLMCPFSTAALAGGQPPACWERTGGWQRAAHPSYPISAGAWSRCCTGWTGSPTADRRRQCTCWQRIAGSTALLAVRQARLTASRLGRQLPLRGQAALPSWSTHGHLAAHGRARRRPRTWKVFLNMAARCTWPAQLPTLCLQAAAGEQAGSWAACGTLTSCRRAGEPASAGLATSSPPNCGAVAWRGWSLGRPGARLQLWPRLGPWPANPSPAVQDRESAG